MKFFEGVAQARTAEMEEAASKMDIINSNFESLLDYIRRLEEELREHGHIITSEGPVINLPDDAQSA